MTSKKTGLSSRWLTQSQPKRSIISMWFFITWNMFMIFPCHLPYCISPPSLFTIYAWTFCSIHLAVLPLFLYLSFCLVFAIIIVKFSSKSSSLGNFFINWLSIVLELLLAFWAGTNWAGMSWKVVLRFLGVCKCFLAIQIAQKSFGSRDGCREVPAGPHFSH